MSLVFKELFQNLILTKSTNVILAICICQRGARKFLKVQSTINILRSYSVTFYKHIYKSSIVAHAYNPSTLESEAEL